MGASNIDSSFGYSQNYGMSEGRNNAVGPLSTADSGSLRGHKTPASILSFAPRSEKEQK